MCSPESVHCAHLQLVPGLLCDADHVVTIITTKFQKVIWSSMYFQRSIGAPTLQQALLKSSRQSLVWGLSVVGGACVGPQGGGRSLGGI